MVDSRAERRSGAGLLAGLTVVALLVGGGWWTTSAPPITPGAVAGPHVNGAVRGTANPTAGSRSAYISIDSDMRVMVDPNTGWPVGRSGSRVAVESPTDRIPADDGVTVANPSRLGTVLWREHRLLAEEDRRLHRQSASLRGARYQLLIMCDGENELAVRVDRGRHRSGMRISRCDGSLHSVGLVGVGGPLSVRFETWQGSPVALTALLVALD